MFMMNGVLQQHKSKILIATIDVIMTSYLHTFHTAREKSDCYSKGNSRHHLTDFMVPQQSEP